MNFILSFHFLFLLARGGCNWKEEEKDNGREGKNKGRTIEREEGRSMNKVTT